MLWAETTISPVQEPEWVLGHCGHCGEKETPTHPANSLIAKLTVLPWSWSNSHFCAHNVAISRDPN